jgi:hypothetical protein
VHLYRINQELKTVITPKAIISLFNENKNIGETAETINKLKGIQKLIAITNSIPRSVSLSFEELKKEKDCFLYELSDSSWFYSDTLTAVCNDWYSLIMRRKRTMMINDAIYSKKNQEKNYAFRGNQQGS